MKVPSPEELRVSEIRQILRSFVFAERGCALREELNSIAKEHYIPRHTPEQYMSWMQSVSDLSFEQVGYQCQIHPYYMSLFTVESQHVYGDCLIHCLDLAMLADSF